MQRPRRTPSRAVAGQHEQTDPALPSAARGITRSQGPSHHDEPCRWGGASGSGSVPSARPTTLPTRPRSRPPWTCWRGGTGRRTPATAPNPAANDPAGDGNVAQMWWSEQVETELVVSENAGEVQLHYGCGVCVCVCGGGVYSLAAARFCDCLSPYRSAARAPTSTVRRAPCTSFGRHCRDRGSGGF